MLASYRADAQNASMANGLVLALLGWEVSGGPESQLAQPLADLQPGSLSSRCNRLFLLQGDAHPDRFVLGVRLWGALLSSLSHGPEGSPFVATPQPQNTS